MKQHTFITFLFIMIFTSGIAQVKEVTRVDTGTDFSCLSFDAEGNLWAGTNGRGLFKSSLDSSGEMGEFQLFYSNDNFNTYNLRSVSTPTVNGRTSIWVATDGKGGGTASGGGIYEFMSTSTNQPRYYRAERNETVAKGLGFGISPLKNDGIPSRGGLAIAADKNGTIWSAHSYHSFTMYDLYNSKYIVTPGGVGRKPYEKGVFDNVAANAMPYPAYTVNPPVDKSPGTRRCVSVGVGNEQVWVGHNFYEKDGGGYKYAGIAKFDLLGNYLGHLNAENTLELPFNTTFTSPTAYSIHFQKNGDPWLSFNFNKGFAVKMNSTYTTGEWIHVEELQHYNKETGSQEPSTLIAGPISFNLMPGLIASAGKRVFLGTTHGLLVYEGKGDIRQDSSYTLLTTADGLSSNNIKAVTTGGGYIYIATDQGVDQVFLPSDLTVYHVSEKEKAFDNSNGKNYEEMASLSSEPMLNNISFDDSALPLFSADGTTSSVFRYYTDDFDGFYNGKYLFALDADYYQDDTARYGKFILKPLSEYEDTDKEYVDLIFRHPSYVDKAFTEAGKDAVYGFTIAEKNRLGDPVFHHKVKITLPPVLLVHGVWSSMDALVDIENGLREEANYQPFKTLKIYKQAFGEAESLFPGDAHHIPDGIKRLIANCKANNMSAGKVSLVVHSRGGLYSRAYIEEIEKGIPYEHNVHSLITLNTPHSGSQLANLVLDERELTIWKPIYKDFPNIKMEEQKAPLGDLFAPIAIPPKDRKNKNGARVLQVDKGFIMDLNKDENLNKIKEYKVPVHAIATTFSFCKLGPDCSPPKLWPGADFPDEVPVFNKAYQFFLKFRTPVREHADDFLLEIFDSETSDIIVPKSSMEAGLAPKYLSALPDLNVAHTDLFGAITGVTSSPEVRGRIIDLLGQNVNDPSSNFSLEGYDPPRGENHLKYTFLQDWDPEKDEQPMPNGRIAAGKDTSLFYMIRPADTVRFVVRDTMQIKLVAENVDEILISYEKNPDSEDHSIFMETRESVSDTNVFNFRIPEQFNGEFSIIAYGFKGNKLVAIDAMGIYAGIPDTIQVKDVFFDSYSPIIEMLEIEEHPFALKGVFTDSVERTINNMEGVSFRMTDPSVATITEDNSIKALKEGFTFLIGTYGNKSDSLQVFVFNNPEKDKTLLGEFYATVNDDMELHFDWATLQEFKVEKFVVEYSSDSINFTPVTAIEGSGTTYEQQEYVYSDVLTALNEVSYYRLRIVDSTESGDIFSAVRTIVPSDLITSKFDGPTMETSVFSLYPNPGTGKNISMKFNHKVTDGIGIVKIININGRLISANDVDLGADTIPLELPDYISTGVYIIQLTTSEGVYSEKLQINR